MSEAPTYIDVPPSPQRPPSQDAEIASAGCKRTIVGVIPEEWEACTIGAVADIGTGGTPNTGNSNYWNGDIAWCVPTDVTGTPGKYLPTTERRISAAGLANSAASLLPAGSLSLCSRATIGDVRIATMPICVNQGFKPLISKNSIDNEFLYYVVLTLKSQMLERASGSTFQEIGKSALSTIPLPVPPLAEQRAIAEALSDVDSLIESLDTLIAKKRAIKKATMQQLLTGKTRLPGFSGKWGKNGWGNSYSSARTWLSQQSSPRAHAMLNWIISNKAAGDCCGSPRRKIQ